MDKALVTDSFENIAREWHTKQLPKWTASHAQKTLRRLEANVFPWFGNQPITQITPPDVLTVLRYIEERGAIETAHRVLQVCGNVFRYAVVCGKVESDPCRDLSGALSPVKTTHHPAITNSTEIAPLMQAIKGYKGELGAASQLCILILLDYFSMLLKM